MPRRRASRRGSIPSRTTAWSTTGAGAGFRWCRSTITLERLPPAQREAFLLHEEAGLTVPEIAAATASNEEAAKSRLRYAMVKLKAAVDDDG
jgi:RNA polymerase sigma-70 factor (ECF subfamily)